MSNTLIFQPCSQPFCLQFLIIYITSRKGLGTRLHSLSSHTHTHTHTSPSPSPRSRTSGSIFEDFPISSSSTSTPGFTISMTSDFLFSRTILDPLILKLRRIDFETEFPRHTWGETGTCAFSVAELAAPRESVEIFRLDSFIDSFNKDCGVFPTFLRKVNAKLLFGVQDLIPAVN